MGPGGVRGSETGGGGGGCTTTRGIGGGRGGAGWRTGADVRAAGRGGAGTGGDGTLGGAGASTRAAGGAMASSGGGAGGGTTTRGGVGGRTGAGRRMRAAGRIGGRVGLVGAGVTGGAGCSAVSSAAFGTLTSDGATAVGAGGGGRGARGVGIPLAASDSTVAEPSCHQSNSPSVRRSARAGKSGCRSWTKRSRASPSCCQAQDNQPSAFSNAGRGGGGAGPWAACPRPNRFRFGPGSKEGVERRPQSGAVGPDRRAQTSQPGRLLQGGAQILAALMGGAETLGARPVERQGRSQARQISAEE
jgi:hypothetical protein